MGCSKRKGARGPRCALWKEGLLGYSFVAEVMCTVGACAGVADAVVSSSGMCLARNISLLRPHDYVGIAPFCRRVISEVLEKFGDRCHP